MRVNFRPSDFRRQVAQEGALVQKNRFFEQNPFLSDDGASLIARPGLKKLIDVGDGPIRGMASEAGSFNGDMFIASGGELWRMDNLLNLTLAGSGLANPTKGVVRMAITAQIGDTPEFLFIADGTNLYVYTDDGYAHGTLSGNPANGDVVRIGDMYYQFAVGSMDVGSPAGTLANPWLVNLSILTINAYANLVGALSASAVPGTSYSTNLVANPNAVGIEYTSTLFTTRARQPGLIGNSVITTTTGAGLTWTGTTLVDGGTPTFNIVIMPDEVGCIDVAVIQSYVIVIPAQVDGYQGRFYWIPPGEITVDSLDFATAERSPDQVFGVQVYEDQFWLPGESTTEVWYVSGANPSDPTAPVMQRLQGVVLDRGSWENTPKAIHETMMIVDADGGVFMVNGSSPKRVSTPDIEEEIRVAMARQRSVIP